MFGDGHTRLMITSYRTQLIGWLTVSLKNIIFSYLKLFLKLTGYIHDFGYSFILIIFCKLLTNNENLDIKSNCCIIVAKCGN